jgi:bacteriocin-like protein
MRDHSNVEELSNRELTDEELSTVSGGAIYMTYGSIKGDVTAKGSENWIELTSF